MTSSNRKGCRILGIIFAALIAASLGVGMLTFSLYMEGVRTIVEHDQVSISVDPLGELLAFTSADGGLFTLNLKKMEVKKLQEEMIGAYESAFSPNGKDIVFASSKHGQHGRSLYRCSRTGGYAARLTLDNDVSDSSPCYSPDGAQLAFFRAYRRRPNSVGGMVFDDYDVCLMDLASGKITRLTHKKHYQGTSVAFAPDGSQIFFSASVGGKESVASRAYKIALSTKAVTEVNRPNQKVGGMGAWISDISSSAAAQKTAFISDRETPYLYDIFVASPEVEFAQPLHITKRTGYNKSPKFSADGRSIYYLAGTSRNAGGRSIFSLFQKDLNGGLDQVANSDLFTNPYDWEPMHMYRVSESKPASIGS